MNRLIRHILLGRQYCGVEYQTVSGKPRVALLELRRKNNELRITRQQILSDVGDIEKSQLPVSLVIGNSHVLHKELQTDGKALEERRLLHQAFPNIQPEDFYYEITRLGGRTLIALCRKDYIREILDNLKGRLQIGSVSLGVMPLAQLTGFGLPAVVDTGTREIRLEPQQEPLLNPSVSEGEYTLNGLSLQGRYLLCFGSVLQLLLGESLTSGNIGELNARLGNTLEQDALFSKGVKAVLGFFLVVLLANFFAFSHFFDQAVILREATGVSTTERERVLQLKKRIAEKEQTLQVFRNQASSSSSRMIDALVRDMPVSILLSSLQYCPLEKKVKEGEVILLSEKRIQISGMVLDNKDFTGWVKQIEGMDWVEDVVIGSFGTDRNHNTVFELNITIR